MLVITRKAGEAIWIGGDIHVCVVETGGNKVQLGITAPRQINIAREEISGKERPQSKKEAKQ